MVINASAAVTLLEQRPKKIQALSGIQTQQLRIGAHHALRLNLMLNNKTVLFYALLDIFFFLCNETTVNLY